MPKKPSKKSLFGASKNPKPPKQSQPCDDDGLSVKEEIVQDLHDIKDAVVELVNDVADAIIGVDRPSNKKSIDTLTIDNFFDEVLEQKVTVVDFYAEWCEPCKKMLKILPNLAKKLSCNARIVKVNTDEQKELVDIYAIKKVPTFVFLVDGAEVRRIEGRAPRLKEIEDIINELLGDEGGVY